MNEKKTTTRHAERERAALRRKQASTVDHLRAGHRYDLVRRAWVDPQDPQGEAVGQ